MLPTYTVENYLKALLQAQIGFHSDELVPMGKLAAALGVVPGTATTMVKTLAESGLVRYEPYAGVRLKLAAHSERELRRRYKERPPAQAPLQTQIQRNTLQEQP